MQKKFPKKIKLAILTKYHRFTEQEALELSSVATMYFRKSPEEINSSSLSDPKKLIILTKVYKIKSDKKHGELIDNLRISSQKQLAEEELFNLKNDYECLIRQKNQLLTKNDKLNTLTKELENLRLKKRETYDSAYRRIYGRRIEEVRAEIREILIKMRKQDKEIGEKIKITESKIKQLENDLSSDKFMTNQEIKKRLLKEEKDKLRIERLRGEARKELFEKEFQAIPEDDKIRFISDEVKEFVWRRDQAKCVKCGSQDSLEFDHIIPFSAIFQRV